MTHWNEAIQTYSTAVAAIFAAVSAAIAVRAMKKNVESSESLLAETQRTNARQGFEQRYTLLLTQHNALHDELCKYLNTEPKIRNDHGGESLLSKFNSEQYGLEGYFNFLTGHPVISPYMRILFHLLKHINEDPYIVDKSDEDKRVYSSPLRSYIRNDVLFLIAVNALNVSSDRLKKAGYPKYQMLLHRFNFFEHAVFTNPRQPNKPFIKDPDNPESEDDINNYADAEREFFLRELSSACSYLKGYVLYAVKNAELPQRQNITITINEKKISPHNLISTPLLACTAVYSNPNSDAYSKARAAYVEEVLERCKSLYTETKGRSEKAQTVLKFINGTYTDLDGVQHTISGIEDLISYKSHIKPYERGKVVIQAPGDTSDKSVTLYSIRDVLNDFTEVGSITWPQDEEHFYVQLKERIVEIMDDAHNTLVSSLRHQFDE